MSTYSWQLPQPAPVAPEPGSPAAAIISALAGRTGGVFDMYIDPTTLDYVDTDDGAWLETADSRTIVMCMLEIMFGEDPFDPEDGTLIKRMLESGEPVTPEIVVAETDRAMGVLVGAGIVSDVTCVGTDGNGAQIVNEANVPTFLLTWRDLASGSPVDLYFTPFA